MLESETPCFLSTRTQSQSGDGCGQGAPNACCIFSEKKVVGQSIHLKKKTLISSKAYL